MAQPLSLCGDGMEPSLTDPYQICSTVRACRPATLSGEPATPSWTLPHRRHGPDRSIFAPMATGFQCRFPSMSLADRLAGMARSDIELHHAEIIRCLWRLRRRISRRGQSVPLAERFHQQAHVIVLPEPAGVPTTQCLGVVARSQNRTLIEAPTVAGAAQTVPRPLKVWFACTRYSSSVTLLPYIAIV